MKRRDLLRHLERHGCELLREGGSHSVYVNRLARKASTVPRHREINEFLARKICRDLDIPEPAHPTEVCLRLRWTVIHPGTVPGGRLLDHGLPCDRRPIVISPTGRAS